jgi:hypothetical protein
MDLLTLAMAKTYTDQKAGYAEENKITVDGSGERFDILGSGSATYVKVSDEPIDLSHVDRIDYKDLINKVEGTVTKENLNYVSIGGIEGVSVGDNELAVVYSFKANNELAPELVGTYAVYYLIAFYTETIHTIDPKFLPPMSNGINIDLDKYGIGSVLLELFAQGGGNATLESVDGPEHLRNLWDVASDQPDADIILTMRVGVTVLVIRGVTKSFIDTQCTSLVFSTLLSDGGSSYLLNVQIMQLDRGATIILRVS